ncbi:hypothetical protein R1sor_021672 [Riccia sorocarpa]|uniref:Thioredoxin-like protein AAED1, chloroplastic n=1 Tax=Riccia sorocarpa TaxID=122646 RepID=A0ABD3GLG9_9MARC
MANLRILVTSPALTQLPLLCSPSSVQTKSEFLHSATALGPSRCASLFQIKKQHFSNVRFSRTPVRASASTSSSGRNIARSLEGVQVLDPSGAKVSLTSLWENRKAVIAFTRHFGCNLCRKKAAVLEARKAELDAAGVALVLIAPGVPEQAKGFLQNNKFTGEVYADPDHAAYEALGVEKGFFSVVNPKSLVKLVQSIAEGFQTDWGLSAYKDTVQSGAWLQGGILVAGPGRDTVHYFFKEAEAGDEPNMDELMSACCATPAAAR